MTTLFLSGERQYAVTTRFDPRYLAPVASFVKWKRAHQQWDNYDEHVHAMQFCNELNREPRCWLETHVAYNRDVQVGVMLMAGGELTHLEKRFMPEPMSLLLKYFHVADRGQGIGSQWLDTVVMPHYRERGFLRMYVCSTHPASFPFYSRRGRVIGEYTRQSYEGDCPWSGRCFMIPLTVDRAV